MLHSQKSRVPPPPACILKFNLFLKIALASNSSGETPGCSRSVVVFSAVVIANFWLHALTPLAFMLWLCCTRLFPYCSYCAYWNIFKTAVDNWNRRTRMLVRHE